MTHPASPHDGYVSPLAGRYASGEMQSIWSDRRKFGTWRRIWLAVARAQQTCGLDITDEQIAELEAHLQVTDEDLARARDHEQRLRHDVMAHVHAWGDVCPRAKGIIHLGMTSQDINDNAELLQLFDAERLIREKVDRLLVALGAFAERWRSLPTLGFTHYQPAQPTTVGRRAAMWASELAVARFDDDGDEPELPTLRGFRGATGTQASFLSLFGTEAATIRFEAEAIWNLLVVAGLEEGTLEGYLGGMSELQDETFDSMLELENDPDLRAGIEEMRAHESLFGHEDFIGFHTFPLTGQTYPRIHDAGVVARLGRLSAVLHKIATDIRLLSNRKEIDEPFGDSQIGSSAMPYKRNPMRCERVCALARFVMNLVPNAYETAATQWLERTLDDSANRRLVLPEAFLALDGCLDLMRNVVEGLVVHEKTIEKNLMAELPFMATEVMLMEAVRLGRDRQEVHEAIRVHSQAAGHRVKHEGLDNDLLDRLRGEPLLEGVDLDACMDPMRHVGLAVEQTDRFLASVIEPLRVSLGAGDGPAPEPSV
jgi:adenylosuccinate lyase